MQFRSTATQSRIEKYSKNRFFMKSVSFFFIGIRTVVFQKRVGVKSCSSTWNHDSSILYNQQYIMPIFGLYKTLKPLGHQGLGLDCNPSVLLCFGYMQWKKSVSGEKSRFVIIYGTIKHLLMK